MNVLFSIDGVLRSESGDLIVTGLATYRAFKERARVILMTPLSRELAEGWLAINNVTDYDDLIAEDKTTKASLMERAKAKGRLDLYVEADPVKAAAGLRDGLTVILFAHPTYARPEFRPDRNHGVRPWDEVVEEITKQQAMKAVDARLKREEEASW